MFYKQPYLANCQLDSSPRPGFQLFTVGVDACDGRLAFKKDITYLDSQLTIEKFLK